MRQFPLRVGLYLAVDCLILVVCFLHIPSLLQRATTPFEADQHFNRVAVGHILDRAASGNIKEGDLILRWQGKDVPIPEAVEFLSDLSSINDTVLIAYQRDGKASETFVRLIPYYPSLRFLIITFFVGIVVWGAGVYILWNGWRDLSGRVLHWVMISFASVVMLTWGAVLPTLIERAVRPYLFFVSYEFGIPLFFFFATLYPHPKSGPRLMIIVFTFIPVVAMLAASFYWYYGALQFQSVADFVRFQSVYDVFHASLFFYIGGGILSLIHSFVTATSSEERQRTQWILWGFTVASAPFLFLYILPQLLFSKYLIDEEYATIAYLVIPFAFAVSFIKYRLFDIDIIVNRSIVYSVLTLFIGVTYVLTVLLFASLIGGQVVFEGYLYVVGITLIIAFLINPARKWIQRIVDESLFAARTNFRTALTAMTTELHSALNAEELFETLADSVSRIVPSETVAVYCLKDNMLGLATFRGSKPTHRTIEPALIERLPVPAHTDDTFDDTGAISLPGNFGFDLCFPMRTESAQLLGIVALRPRVSTLTYDENERDFILASCGQAEEILERLLLQERIILERGEKKRLEELSNLKSDFVSYVSHELRTPLTSIKMFSHLLKPLMKPGGAKGKEYLTIIDGESDRLGRMVTNILDAARIEKGTKEYHLSDVDLCEIVTKALQSMKYQLQQRKFKVRIKVPRQALMIRADRDAVSQAIVNLVANSIKYSAKKKIIVVEVGKKGRTVLCRVTDSGIGISKEAIPHLFEKFYREPSHSGPVEGVGLGLSLVKHIMDEHKGRVTVRSTPGKGSSFTLVFPRLDRTFRRFPRRDGKGR